MASRSRSRLRGIPRTRFPRCEQTGKLRYPERNDATYAVKIARRMRSRAEITGITCSNRVARSYRCEHCSGWHLTSMRYWFPAEEAIDA
ncbi:hypothetical protein [Rhodococcus rhodochrous]|uniref:hypothetical protein n=1 Tax=Rhodococcus rhodochrous TaxID=1829 RepID=UPI001E581C94|nr:hypothetical protein [Rhodococcus rhodochrous]MCB8913568.1 hypothetical protein [Rhodococcus rhodochrous]